MYERVGEALTKSRKSFAFAEAEETGLEGILLIFRTVIVER